MTTKVFSFDVFDTVITRTVFDPKDVFLLVQQRIGSDLPELPGRVAGAYRGTRVWSEFVARRRHDAEDVNLDQIYHVLGGFLGLGEESLERLMALEMRVENALLIPVAGAAEFLGMKRQAAGKVVFISDMYHSADFIRAILEKYDLFRPGDLLYVSGEFGLTKGSGNLFRQVLSDLGIAPEELMHFGDNPVTDYEVPSRLGIGLHYPISAKPVLLSRVGILKSKTRYARELLHARFQMGLQGNV